MNLFDPKDDLVFKLLLNRHSALLPDMLSGVLERPVLRATIVGPTSPTEIPLDKEVAFDVRAELDDGSRAIVEMQRRLPRDFRSRLVYYCTRDYSSQLDRGDSYRDLSPTHVIAWLDEPLFRAGRFHSVFELRERNTSSRFSDHLAIHILQLGALSPNALSRAPATDYAAIVQRWARFFVADPAELDALAEEDHIMSTAKQTLEDLSRDPHAQRLVREREDARKLFRMELAAAKAEGVEEGKAELLLSQLRSRFGPLPETAVATVRSAPRQRLDVWAQRVLTAHTLDEVLAP